MPKPDFKKDLQYYKFCLYGFLKNLRFFEPFLMLFFLEKDLTFLMIGVLYSVREIARNILEIPAGLIADSIGRRRSMIMAFAFYLVSFVGFYFGIQYWHFILSMLFYAFGDAFRTGTHKAMIFEYLIIHGWEDQKVFYYGNTRSWSQAGSAISSLLAGLIVFYFDDISLVFLFSGIPYILDLLLMVTYPRFLDGKSRKLKYNDIPRLLKQTGREFLQSFKNARFLKSVVNVSSFSGYYKAVKDYIQPILQAAVLGFPVLYAYSTDQKAALLIALLYFIIFMLSAFASRFSGRVSMIFQSNRAGLIWLLVIGLSVGIFSGIALSINLTEVAIVIFMLIFLIENLRKPLGVAYISESIQKEVLATGLSVESQVKTIFAAIIAPLLGFLADKFGIGMSLCIVSLFLFLSVLGVAIKR